MRGLQFLGLPTTVARVSVQVTVLSIVCFPLSISGRGLADEAVPKDRTYSNQTISGSESQAFPPHSTDTQQNQSSARSRLEKGTDSEQFIAVVFLVVAVAIWLGALKIFIICRRSTQALESESPHHSTLRKYERLSLLLLLLASLPLLQAASHWWHLETALLCVSSLLVAYLWGFTRDLKPLQIGSVLKQVELEKEQEFERLREEVQQCDMTLHAVLDSINEGIVAIDTEGQFTCFNYWARKMLGKGAITELKPLQWAEHYPLFYARDNSPVASDDFPLLRAMQGEFVSDWELLIENSDGKRLVNVNATPLCNSGAGAAVMVLQDITELKLAEAELEQQHRLVQQERRLLDTIVENLPHAVFWKDKESNYIGCNSVFAKMAGCARSEEIKGLNDFELPWPREDAKFYRECDQQVMSGAREIRDMEETRTNPDGEERILWTSKVRMLNEEGEVVGIVGSFLDVTDYRTAENERSRLNSELQKVSRQAGMAEIATGVLHNVGNVINSVNVSATTLQRGFESKSLERLQKVAQILLENEGRLVPFFTEDRQGKLFPSVLNELVTQMHQEVNSWQDELSSLHEHVNHLREVVTTQQSNAKAANTFELNDLQKLLRDAAKMSGVDRVSGIDLVDQSEKLQPIATSGHKVLQILVNLLTNAKHAIAESPTKAGTITMRLFAENELLSATVTDTGVGISPDNLRKLFSHGFTTRKTGHGFGLHSCAILAKELGGSLSAQSPGEGEGATFKLQLPLAGPNESTELFQQDSSLAEELQPDS